MPNITARTIKTAQPISSAYFIRDSNLRGFALRVFPSGTIKYIAEVWYNGKSHRKTLGSYRTNVSGRCTVKGGTVLEIELSASLCFQPAQSVDRIESCLLNGTSS